METGNLKRVENCGFSGLKWGEMSERESECSKSGKREGEQSDPPSRDRTWASHTTSARPRRNIGPRTRRRSACSSLGNALLFTVHFGHVEILICGDMGVVTVENAPKGELDWE